MSYQLQSVPAPEIKRGAPVQYPFADMNTTDCNFFVVEPDADFVEATGKAPAEGTNEAVKVGSGLKKTIGRLKGAQQRWKKATGNKDHKFLVAEYTDPMGSGVKAGVWRTA